MSCQASHKYIFYKRLTAIPDGFSLYNTLYHTWASKDNQLNVDFALYSTYEDALRDLSRWTFCNYDDNGVGFPRDCGPTGYVGGQWNNPGRHNYGFYVDVGITAANSGDDGDRVFISNGGGTMCAQEEGGSVQTHAAPFDEDGKIQYHLTADVCRQFESGASYYDTNIYDSWTRASAATQNRQRRSTAANFLVIQLPTRIGDCTEWVCKDGSESCAGDEQVCFRAENNAGWSTWIKGENIARDTSCQTWVCHSGAGKCDGANGILPQYRCLESTEGLVCKDYHLRVPRAQRQHPGRQRRRLPRCCDTPDRRPWDATHSPNADGRCWPHSCRQLCYSHWRCQRPSGVAPRIPGGNDSAERGCGLGSGQRAAGGDAGGGVQRRFFQPAPCIAGSSLVDIGAQWHSAATSNTCWRQRRRGCCWHRRCC